MVVFIRDHLMRTGLSTSFSDFMDIPAFFRQAKAALEYGEKADHTTWIHAFADLRLEYILHNGLYTLPPKALIPAELLALIAYDQTHHANLYDTFRIYLQENCNIQKTIEKRAISSKYNKLHIATDILLAADSMAEDREKQSGFLLYLRSAKRLYGEGCRNYIVTAANTMKKRNEIKLQSDMHAFIFPSMYVSRLLWNRREW